jgi:hypothetical protein
MLQVPGPITKDVTPPNQAGGADDSPPLGYWWRKITPARPTRRAVATLPPRPSAFEDVGSQVQIASLAVIAVLASIFGFRILASSFSLPVKASLIFLVALFAVTLPSRLGEAGHTFLILIVVSGVFLAPATIISSYGWQIHNDPLLMLSAVFYWVGGFIGIGGVGAVIWMAIFSSPENQNIGLDIVRGQNADIDAGYAEDARVARALKAASKGTSTDDPPPYKYHD